MNWHVLALPTIIIGVIIYHLAQKTIPGNANPFVTLAAAYSIALTLSVAALFVRGDFQKGQEFFRNQDWRPILFLGLSAIAIELGYLYAYRTGWRISTTGIMTGAFTTTVLAVIGVVWFGEQLTLLHLTGSLLCLAGIACIVAG